MSFLGSVSQEIKDSMGKLARPDAGHLHEEFGNGYLSVLIKDRDSGLLDRAGRENYNNGAWQSLTSAELEPLAEVTSEALGYADFSRGSPGNRSHHEGCLRRLHEAIDYRLMLEARSGSFFSAPSSGLKGGEVSLPHSGYKPVVGGVLYWRVVIERFLDGGDESFGEDLAKAFYTGCSGAINESGLYPRIGNPRRDATHRMRDEVASTLNFITALFSHPLYGRSDKHGNKSYGVTSLALLHESLTKALAEQGPPNLEHFPQWALSAEAGAIGGQADPGLTEESEPVPPPEYVRHDAVDHGTFGPDTKRVLLLEHGGIELTTSGSIGKTYANKAYVDSMILDNPEFAAVWESLRSDMETPNPFAGRPWLSTPPVMTPMTALSRELTEAYNRRQSTSTHTVDSLRHAFKTHKRDPNFLLTGSMIEDHTSPFFAAYNCDPDMSTSKETMMSDVIPTSSSPTPQLSAEELRESIARHEELIAFYKQSLAETQTPGSAALQSGRSMADAVKHGMAIATIGRGTAAGSDVLIGMFGDNVPALLQTDEGKAVLALVPPALIIGGLDLAPLMGFNVPAKQAQLLRSAALLALEHAGVEGTRVALDRVMSLALPMIGLYMMGAEQAAAAAAAPALGNGMDFGDVIEKARADAMANASSGSSSD